jgi:hypothetical protein
MANSATIITRPHLVVPYLVDGDIAHQAHALRTEYEKVARPASTALDPEHLIWDLLYGRDDLSLDNETSLGVDGSGERIVGSMNVVPPGGVIYIDADVVGKPFYSFTVAHEIGHWILHRAFVLEQLCHDRALMEGGMGRPAGMLHTLSSGVTEEPRLADLLREEWQANCFASHLLMPEQLIRREFILRFGRPPFNYTEHCRDERGFARRFRDLRSFCRYAAEYRTVPGRQNLMEVCGVSRSAMAYRLEKLGMVVTASKNNEF